MASAGSRGAAVALPRPRSRADLTKRADVATAAWLFAVPCAAVTIALVVLLGPPLSRALYPAAMPVLPTVGPQPEPVEDTRYLLALLGPVLLAASIVFVGPRLRVPRRAVALTGLAQLLALGVVVACFVRQEEPRWVIGFFTVAQLAGAGVAAVPLTLAARRGWLSGWRPEPRRLRVLLPAVALVVTGIWFLSFINTADTFCRYGDCYNSAFQIDETFAVLNGLTPFVNHSAAYGSLWPFVLAPLLAVLGKTVLVYTSLMWALSVAMLLALYGVLRRVTHSSLASLALYLPVMAFTYFAGSRDVHEPIAIYQQVPLRNAAPFLVAWLVARRLDRDRGATWPLFAAAGLAVLNNVDFGVAALGATVAALLLGLFPLSPARLGRLAASVVVGLVAALALLTGVTLIRAGALPDPARAAMFAHIYGVDGVGVWPLRQIVGLPLAIFLTYTAALAVAAVRAICSAPNRTLTGMLAWSGIFGFGSGAYFMGASVPMGVPTLFPAWGLSLALLTVVAVQHATRTLDRRSLVPVLATLFGIALLGSFALIPPVRLAPWSQVERLTTPPPVLVSDNAEPYVPPPSPGLRRFVSSIADGRGHFVVRRGAPVALLTATGHVLADAYGLKDVVPYTGESTFTAGQVDEVIDRLRAAGGNTILVLTRILPRVSSLLASRGFEVLTTSGWRAGVPGESIPEEALVTRGEGALGRSVRTRSALVKWVDGRALRAAAQP